MQVRHVFLSAALLATYVTTASAQPTDPAPQPEPVPPVEPIVVPPPPEPAPPAVVTEVAPAPSEPAKADKPATKTDLKLGKGITFTTADDDAKLSIRGRLQLRASQFSEDPGEPPEVTEFQARRIRLLFQGHVRGGEFEYYLQLGFSNGDTESDLRLPLRDAYITYTAVRDLNIRGGQMKVPFGRQRVISSSALQMVDRSIVTGELNLDRDVGVQLMSEDLGGLGGKLGYNLGLFSGDGRNRLAEVPGVLLVGRVVVRPMGKFEDSIEGDHAREKTPKLAIGFGGAHNNNTNRQRSTFNSVYEFARFDYWHAGADLVFKYQGLSILSEIMYRKSPTTSVEGMVDGDTVREYARNAWGYYAQAGYFVGDHAELVARYGSLHPRGSTDPALVDGRREAGGGFNWYFQKHDLKLQTDYFYLFAPGDDGVHQARVQMQLYF